MDVSIVGQYCQIDVDFLIKIDVFLVGTRQTPTTSLLTLKRGSETLFEDQSATIKTGDDAGQIQYTIPSANLDQIYQGMVLNVKYTISATQYQTTFYLYVVQMPITNCLQESDLKLVYPRLDAGLSSGQTTFSTFRDSGFKEVETDLNSIGRPPDMIQDSQQIYQMLKEKAYELTYRDWFQEPGDKYHTLYMDHKANYETLLINTKLLYDKNRDGIPDTEETAGSASATI